MTGPAQAGSGRPVVLFVLGAARSGTSALARVLSLCGGALPSALVGAMPDNPLGHWEPRVANVINEKILRRLGSSGFDPSMRIQEEGALTAADKAAGVEEIRAFLATLPKAPFVVIKDPRISLLTDMWFEAAQLAGFDVANVIAVRHPQEVVASIGQRSVVSPKLSSALWLKVNLVTEAQTRDAPRVFVEYVNLLEDWQREMQRVSSALGIDLGTRDEAAIEEFLRPTLRHERHGGPAVDLFGADWISSTYESLRAAARDEPWDPSALDRILDAYRVVEADFRAVFEGYQHIEKVNRYFRPSVMKMIYEVRAIANRRRGTWA
ncbi:sulfotransferase family protein [Mycolicibacterium holsaticum]|uniref:sulfotransferase family protein n=1 Tax=Mycolicibacterium holsaticum TaxID=152142 RepID=UPI001C7DF57E|nr:sulfotransferase family protein [Mycolicibacterium holsaticum]QZA11253.1 sulfotransferase family protein [Mycolicibacterium holsaticum DSM 44478 = JCM 12374]UNC11256.1 sulfotransferase family protein [Mycolicibacterium holsaticum DSM 44478 = JCM 12374]